MSSISIPPVIPLIVAALITVTRIRKQLPFLFAVLVDGLIALVVWTMLPHPSIAPWWGLLTSTVAHWPSLWTNAPRQLAHGGPLGTGCFKILEVLVAISLWRAIHQEWPSISLGPMPDITAWVGILILSAGVNAVMLLWSKLMKSRGNHKGVDDMVQSTRGRALSRKEQAQIFTLAMLNSACEEVTSRWFWMSEFQTYLPAPIHANLAQALVFGIWHYHGIPSGWTGVCLTFVYGFIMGWLYQYGQGLLLPVLAHGIADYYIFAIIVRQKDKQG